jgi:hypothetical protein
MAYQRKTADEYQIRQDWGYGHGFEEVAAYDNRKEAVADLKSYREAQKVPTILVKVRVKKTATA